MLELLLVSVGLSAAGAVLSLLLSRSHAAAKVVACLFGMAASLASLGSGITAITSPDLLVSIAGIVPFANLTLLFNPLAGLLISVISVLAFVAWLYGLSYFNEYYDKGIGAIGFFMNLFVASMLFVILSDNAFWFLVFFELMSLTSYFLVIVEQKPASIRGGFLYLVMAHIGFLMITIAYFLMATTTGSLEFSAWRATAFDPTVATIVFTLAFFGFGAKAGIVPFHSWLPQAHPAAPSNVSALMSGGMIKIGIFGIVKVCFDLLGACDMQVGWGVLVLIIGAVSSVLGVVYALGEHDLKSLLAYHSVENIGIILLGVGAGIIGVATANLWLAGIGLMAGLYHLINHAMFKGLLFLGAGSVLHATGTRNMEVLGGLARLMPVTAVCFLAGSMAISAIPPLNGFVSEWYTYQALIGAAMADDILLRVVFAFAIVALAITGALAVTCFVKAFGVTFLGRGRSEVATSAHEVPAPMLAGMIILALICVCLGLGAAWVAPAVMGIASSVIGSTGAGVAAGAVLVAIDTSSVVSPLVIAVAMIVVIGVLVIARNAANKKHGMKVASDPWACGYAPDTHMAPIASTVGANVHNFMGPLYAIRSVVNSVGAAAASACARGLAPEDVAVAGSDEERIAGSTREQRARIPLSDSVLSTIHSIGALFGRLEGGDSRNYIVYIVCALVFFLALIILVR